MNCLGREWCPWGRTCFTARAGALALGWESWCVSPHALSHPPFSTKPAPGCPCPQPAGRVRAPSRERTGRQRPAHAACEQEQRQTTLQLFTAGGGGAPPSAPACGGEAQAVWPQRASSKPSKLRLLRVRANTCPLLTARGLRALPPEASPQSLWVQHTSARRSSGHPRRPDPQGLHPGPSLLARPGSGSHRGSRGGGGGVTGGPW